MITELITLGDSISKGVYYDEQQKRLTIDPLGYVQRLASELGLENYNLATFGATITRGIRDFVRRKARVPFSEHSLVLLEYGGNDCDFPWPEVSKMPSKVWEPNTVIETFRQSYLNLIAQVKETGAFVCLLNLPPLVPDRFFTWISQQADMEGLMAFYEGDPTRAYRWQELYSLIVPEIADQAGVPWIDIRRPFLEHYDYEKFLCPDGFHPNPQGQELIYQAVRDFLQGWKEPFSIDNSALLTGPSLA